MMIYRNIIAPVIRREISRLLRKYSYVHVDEFTKPYIIRKHIEGVDFLFSITDSHARLWYDLYSTDPTWLEMRFIRDNLVRQGDVIIECGSHHGCTTILLSDWVGPKGLVYAYEPGRINYATLQENIALNRITNVRPINAVVGPDDASVDFEEHLNESMGSKVTTHNVNEFHRVGTQRYEIEQVSLDRHSTEQIALIKIDTQGYVYQPLEGAKRIIQDQKPNLSIEIDSRAEIERYGNNFQKIFEIIAQDEYTFFAQFEAAEQPLQMELEEVLREWEKRNKFSKDIHLFAKNTRILR